MINLEFNGKVRLSISLLAIAGAYVAVRILKNRGVAIHTIDGLAKKIKSFSTSSESSEESVAQATDIHAAIALALSESGLVADEAEVQSITIKPRTGVQSAWASKVQTLRRYPGQD